MGSISDIPGQFKALRLTDLILAVLLVSVAVASFALGRLSVPAASAEVRICQNNELTGAAETEGFEPKLEAAAATAGGGYVASQTGERYHLPWCSGAQRIKPENLIHFDTKEQAEAAGYTPALNCKGI